MTEYNTNESTINENAEDKLASDQAAAEAHEPSEAIESAHLGDDRLTPEKLGDAAIKFATETAYAAAGFAGLVGDKAKSFYDEQKKQYIQAHPDEDGPSAKAFLDQLSDQLSRLADDLSRGYRDMAEKGREVVSRNTPTKPATGPEGSVNDGETRVSSDATTFSNDLSEDVTQWQVQDDVKSPPTDAAPPGSVNDGDSPVAEQATTFASDLSGDVSEAAPEHDELMRNPTKQDGIL